MRTERENGHLERDKVSRSRESAVSNIQKAEEARKKRAERAAAAPIRRTAMTQRRPQPPRERSQQGSVAAAKTRRELSIEDLEAGRGSSQRFQGLKPFWRNRNCVPSHENQRCRKPLRRPTSLCERMIDVLKNSFGASKITTTE